MSKGYASNYFIEFFIDLLKLMPEREECLNDLVENGFFYCFLNSGIFRSELINLVLNNDKILLVFFTDNVFDFMIESSEEKTRDLR